MTMPTQGDPGHDPQRATDEAAIRALHQRLLDAWEQGSGEAFAAPERDSIQMLVAVREAGGWSFVSFQNTRIRPIGANPLSAVLWLIPDKLWGLLFRASKAAPRMTTDLSDARSPADRRGEG